MDHDQTPTLSSSLSRRRVLAGTAGLGAAALLGAKIAQAQSTPEAGTDSTESQSHYDDFVNKLAANLNISDPATVDTAIRASLTQIVDEALADGNISQNAADQMKENIATGDVPFLFPGRHDRRGKGRRHGGEDGPDDQHEGDDSADGTPTTSA